MIPINENDTSPSEEIVNQATNLKKMMSPTRVITFMSGKVGMGHTTTLVNLAVALANQMDYQILLFDARRNHPHNNRYQMYDLLGASTQKPLQSVTDGDLPFEAQILSSRYDPIHIFCMGSNSTRLKADQTEHAQHLEIQLKNLVKSYELIMLDLGHVYSGYPFNYPALSPELVTLTTPRNVDRTGCYGMLKDIGEVGGQTHINLVVNMAGHAQQAENVGRGIQTAAKNFLNQDLHVLGSIPLDLDVIDASRQHEPFVDMYPDTPASTAINQIAASLQERHEEYKMTLVKLGGLLVQHLIEN